MPPSPPDVAPTPVHFAPTPMPPPPPPPPAPLPPEPVSPGFPTYVAVRPGAGARQSRFTRRLFAFVVDALLYGLVLTVLALPGCALLLAGGMNRLDECTTAGRQLVCPAGTFSGGPLVGGSAMVVGAYVVVVIVYLRALGRTGQTWGRRIVGTRVVDVQTGRPIGMGRALARQLFAHYISAPVFCLGYFWMLWDADNETWHDKVASTAVVDAAGT